MSSDEVEEDVLPERAIRVVAAAVVAAVIALGLLTQAILAAAEGRLRPSHTFSEAALGPPRARADLFARPDARPSGVARDRALLDGYGWVDRDRGIVRIPIERAIDVVAGEEK